MLISPIRFVSQIFRQQKLTFLKMQYSFHIKRNELHDKYIDRDEYVQNRVVKIQLLSSSVLLSKNGRANEGPQYYVICASSRMVIQKFRFKIRNSMVISNIILLYLSKEP